MTTEMDSECVEIDQGIGELNKSLEDWLMRDEDCTKEDLSMGGTESDDDFQEGIFSSLNDDSDVFLENIPGDPAPGEGSIHNLSSIKFYRDVLKGKIFRI